MDVLKFGVEFDVDPAIEGLEEVQEAAEGVGAGLAERLSAAGDALGDFGLEGSRSGRAITGFASAVSLVSPGVGAAARSVAVLARGLGVLRLGMGPLAVGFAAMTAAVALFQRQQAAADATRQRSIALAEASKVADDKLTTAREALAVATGDLTAEEVKINQIRRQGMVESLPAFKQHVEAISEEQAAVETLRKRLESLSAQRLGAATRAAQEAGRMGENTDGVRAAAKGHEQLGQNIARTRAELAAKEQDLTAAQGKLEAYTQTVKEAIQTEVAAVVVTKENEDAIKANAEAERRRAKLLQQVEEAQRNAAASAKTYEASLRSLEQMAADATAGQLTGIDAVIHARDRALAQAREEFRTANAAAQSEAQAAAARAQYTAAEVALQAQAQAEITKLRAEAIAEEKRQRDQAAAEEAARRAAEQDAITTGYAQMASAVSDITALMADKLAENGKRGALALFRISQAAALAEIAINTIAAANKALLLGPVAGPIAAAGIYATGAAQAAAVAAQAPPEIKHGGGVIRARSRAPDEVDVLARDEEFMLNGTGRRMYGDAALHAANRGESPWGGPSYAVLVLNNRIVDTAATEAYRAGGTLRAAINTPRRSGRWADRRG
jgi:hypothetical protein